MKLAIRVYGPTTRRVRHHREQQQVWKIVGARKLPRLP